MRSEGVNNKESAATQAKPVDPRGKFDADPRQAGPKPAGAAKFLSGLRTPTPTEPPLRPMAKQPETPAQPLVPEAKSDPLPGFKQNLIQPTDAKLDNTLDRGPAKQVADAPEVDTPQAIAAPVMPNAPGATPDVAAVAAGFAAAEPASVRKSMRVGRDANGAVTVTLDLDTAGTHTPLRMTQVDPETVAVSLGRGHQLSQAQIDDLLARLRNAAGNTNVVLVHAG